MADLACPYCGTENRLGQIWLAQRDEAEQAYERKREEENRKWSPYVYNRVISRVLLVELGLLLAVLLGSLLFFLGRHLWNDLTFVANREAVWQQLDSWYQEGDYRRMGSYLYQYEEDLESEDEERYRLYEQAQEMQYELDEFQVARMGFMQMSTQEKQEDSYRLHYLLFRCGRMLDGERVVYEEVNPSNTSFAQELREEATACLLKDMKLTQEEFQLMAETEYLSGTEIDALEEKVRARNGW